MSCLWTDVYKKYASLILLDISVLIRIIGGVTENSDFADKKHEVDWNGWVVLVYFFFIGLFFSYDYIHNHEVMYQKLLAKHSKSLKC